MKKIFILSLFIMSFSAVSAKIDLVTLPARATVQLNIYNSADLTLARENRALTLKTGQNKLQFSWENTLIDPTSLEMLPRANADKIDISDLVFPPRVRNLGLWNIQSEISGKVPVEITYFTSGLSWQAFYMGTLSPDEKTMHLQGYVRVTNNSGEDYENAQVRLVVGKIHILDEIAQLARRQYPYGRPGVQPGPPAALNMRKAARLQRRGKTMLEFGAAMASAKPKEIKKEGLSEYFLYTIEGTETIPNGYSKRLPSFDTTDIPVVNLYKYEQQRFGNSVVRFLSFKNDKKHQLGQTPIPGGTLEVYRRVDARKHLSYEGQSSFKYIPVNEDVELNLGAVSNVVVEPKLMEYRSENYRFDYKGNVSGWDEIRQYKVKVKNTRNVPVRIEIKRRINTPYWSLQKAGQFGTYEKVDLNTIKFTLDVQPRATQVFTYTLTTYNGTRQDEVRR